MKKILGYVLFAFWAFMAIGFAAFSIPVGVAVGLASLMFLPFVQESLSNTLNRKIGIGYAFIGLGLSMVLMMVMGVQDKVKQEGAIASRSSSSPTQEPKKVLPSVSDSPELKQKVTPIPSPASTATATPVPTPTATATPVPTKAPIPTPTPVKAPDYSKQAARIYKDLQHYLMVGNGMKNVRESKSITANCGKHMRQHLPAVELLSKEADKLHSSYAKVAQDNPFKYVKLASAGMEMRLCVTCSTSLAPRACKQAAEALKSYASGEWG